MRPIPKKLLIHSGRLEEKTQKDRWGAESLQKKADLSHIRVEPSERRTRDKNNQEIHLAAVLIYDCKNSRPKQIAFQTDQIVEFQEERYQITSVEPFYDEKRLHHLEMGMVRYDSGDSQGDLP